MALKCVFISAQAPSRDLEDRVEWGLDTPQIDGLHPFLQGDLHVVQAGEALPTVGAAPVRPSSVVVNLSVNRLLTPCKINILS